MRETNWFQRDTRTPEEKRRDMVRDSIFREIDKHMNPMRNPSFVAFLIFRSLVVVGATFIILFYFASKAF